MARADALLARAAPAGLDLLVLPEMAFTGARRPPPRGGGPR